MSPVSMIHNFMKKGSPTIMNASLTLSGLVSELDAAPPHTDKGHRHKWTDYVSPDVPDGYDTYWGFMVKYHREAFDLIEDPIEDIREDVNLIVDYCEKRGISIASAYPPPTLVRQGAFVVRCFPVSVLERMTA